MSDPSALLALLDVLDAQGYDFVSPTPATHERFLRKRRMARPANLRDIFGWNLPFEHLTPDLLSLMRAAGVLESSDPVGQRSTVRVSRLMGRLFLHSAFPTNQEDSVFLGPDSYRFAAFIIEQMRGPVTRLVDLGTGAGVGAIVAAAKAPEAGLALVDINPKALRLAKVNAAHAGLAVEAVEAEGLAGVAGEVDLVLANPPYMIDGEGRAYRDGGGKLGAGISIQWARQALDRLPVGGRLLLYTGSAIVDGQDGLKLALEAIPGAVVSYRELDPDVFGEELEKPAYAGVERIAAVGAVLTRL
jgi:methylase of polypeptide subunit release factors